MGLINRNKPALEKAAAIALFLLVLAGCKSGGFSGTSPNRDLSVHIKRVSYSKAENGTVVKIYGSKPFHHTAYKLADPLRLAVEISDAVLDFETSTAPINGANVTHLTVVRFHKAKTVRVEMQLKVDAPYRVREKGRLLEVFVADNPGIVLGKEALGGAETAPAISDEAAGRNETLVKENMRLRRELLDAKKRALDLEERNHGLREKLEATRKHGDETRKLTSALQRRILEFEKKLSEIESKISNKEQ
jgi:predicted component of type VI protein secretion system